VGRQGGRGRRQDRGDQLQGDRRLGEVHDRPCGRKAWTKGGLAWDDTNNNRAFLSQTISATLNGASIYIESLRKPDQYKTEKGKPLNTDILHAPLPKGPAGQFGFHLLQSNMIMKYSKNQDAGRSSLKYLHAEANYRKFFESQKGFATPCTAKWEDDKLWSVDPVMTPYKVAAKLGQSIGFAGAPNAKAQEVLSKYIVTDMYAKAVQECQPRMRQVGRIGVEEGLLLKPLGACS
jgi:multiple sugar transport system substrate-binding protein